MAIAPAGGEGQKDEENEEGLVNIVAAVIDHDGRDGGKESGGQGGVPAQTVGDQKEQQNQADAEENSEGPQAEFGEAGEIPGQGQFFPDQGGVGEGGSVEFGWVVAVTLAFPQIGELDGIIGLVAVHGPAFQLHGAQAHGEQGRQQHPEPKAPGHLAGRP